MIKVFNAEYLVDEAGFTNAAISQNKNAIVFPHLSVNIVHGNRLRDTLGPITLSLNERKNNE
jgi:hypothetical protein